MCVEAFADYAPLGRFAVRDMVSKNPFSLITTQETNSQYRDKLLLLVLLSLLSKPTREERVKLLRPLKRPRRNKRGKQHQVTRPKVLHGAWNGWLECIEETLLALRL